MPHGVGATACRRLGVALGRRDFVLRSKVQRYRRRCGQEFGCDVSEEGSLPVRPRKASAC